MKQFSVRPDPPEEYTREFPEYPLAIIKLLYHRQLLHQVAVDAFLDPQYHALHDPFLFHDMQKACERIYRSIQSGELIAVHGDYDADGVSASVVLQNTLEKLGGRTIVFLPHRDKDGYGLNPRTVDYLHEQGVQLIITCDCGISNAIEIERASSRGIDTIITDHHQIPERLPAAHAIIHPKIVTETYPFKHLAGGGVAFKLAQGLLASPHCTLVESEREAFEKWLLDLVSLSTVADMVELSGENRVLVKYGLLVLSKNKRLGLQKLFREARIDPAAVTTQTISFQVAPRINAAGRMDHANAAYLLLRATDPLEAERLAKILEQQNKERQRVTDTMYREALKDAPAQQGALSIFFNKDWSAGLTGLVAGKLSKELGKPVFVMGFDGERIAGSGRSPDGISILDGVNVVKEKLLSYGGHPQACGFRLPEEKYAEVCADLHAYFDSTLSADAMPTTIMADVELRFPMITWELADYLRKFEPFGQGNSEPIFYSKGVTIKDIKPVGQKLNHLKMALAQDGVAYPAIAFSMSESAAERGSLVDILYTVNINQWNGNRELQLQVQDMRASV